jgi:hypothetical protein
MSDTVFNQLVLRLLEFDEHGIPFDVRFGHLGEPTMDKQVWHRADYLRKKLKNGSVGIHTNGLTLSLDEEKANSVDYIVTSILGGASGEFSFFSNTGLDLVKHTNMIKEQSSLFKGDFVVVLTLPPTDSTDDIEYVTNLLKGANVSITLNPLLHPSVDKSVVRKPIPATRVFNGIEVTSLPRKYLQEEKRCTMLEKLTTITHTGLYGICCLPAFGPNNALVSVFSHSLFNHVRGDRKKSCREFLLRHQSKPFTSCNTCVLASTFKVDTQYI